MLDLLYTTAVALVFLRILFLSLVESASCVPQGVHHFFQHSFVRLKEAFSFETRSNPNALEPEPALLRGLTMPDPWRASRYIICVTTSKFCRVDEPLL